LWAILAQQSFDERAVGVHQKGCDSFDSLAHKLTGLLAIHGAAFSLASWAIVDHLKGLTGRAVFPGE
jgi:hypothetical protein